MPGGNEWKNNTMNEEERKAYQNKNYKIHKERYKTYNVYIDRGDAMIFEEKCKELGIKPVVFFREQVNRFLRGY